MAELIKGSNFNSGQDVRDEFGTTTLANVGNRLSNMYNKIFGSLPVAGDRQSDFAGTGHPEGTNGSIGQECSGGSFRPLFNGTIDFYGGATASGVCEYRWKYDTDPLFPSPSYTSWQSTGANGSVSGQPASFGFSDGQTVYAELQLRNEYNEDAESDYTETSSGNSVTFSKSTLNTPSLSGQTVQHDGSNFYLEFSYADGDNVSSWTVEMRVDGTNEGSQTINCTDFNSGSNIQGIQGQQNPLTVSETVEFRVKASGDACANDSAFSSWETSTSTSVPSCPISV